MAHVITDKKKLIARVRRIRGQVEGVERALEADEDCHQILETIASIRGALRGLMSEVMEGHLLNHVLDTKHKPVGERTREAKKMIEILKTFVK